MINDIKARLAAATPGPWLTIKNFFMRLLNPCYQCKWESECKEAGYCGDSGMSFYQKKESKNEND